MRTECTSIEHVVESHGDYTYCVERRDGVVFCFRTLSDDGEGSVNGRERVEFCDLPSEFLRREYDRLVDGPQLSLAFHVPRAQLSRADRSCVRSPEHDMA